MFLESITFISTFVEPHRAVIFFILPMIKSIGDEGIPIVFIEDFMRAIMGLGDELRSSTMAKKFRMVLQRKLSIIPG